MKLPLWLCIGVFTAASCSMRSAHALQEVQGPPPVPLPQCTGVRATNILNRAIQSGESKMQSQLEMIDDAQQTNFGLDGTRLCTGSMITRGGERFTGTWSYSRSGNRAIRVKYSLQPSP